MSLPKIPFTRRFRVSQRRSIADDVWREADENLQARIHQQWEAKREETSGHTWNNPPEWLKAYPEIETNPAKGIPFPSFKWDEERRARLRAELEALYAHLYSLTKDELAYILNTFLIVRRKDKGGGESTGRKDWSWKHTSGCEMLASGAKRGKMKFK